MLRHILSDVIETLDQVIFGFQPRDAMQCVVQDVCPCVTFRYCGETAKFITCIKIRFY